jgi:hypothetical protein
MQIPHLNSAPTSLNTRVTHRLPPGFRVACREPLALPLALPLAPLFEKLPDVIYARFLTEVGFPVRKR